MSGTVGEATVTLMILKLPLHSRDISSSRKGICIRAVRNTMSPKVLYGNKTASRS